MIAELIWFEVLGLWIAVQSGVMTAVRFADEEDEWTDTYW